MGATKLMTAAGGGITLDAASTATDKTVTIPARTGNVAIDGPAFRANTVTAQTITNNTFVKVAYNVEEFDTNSNYDPTTNYRFQPTVAGYYQINANASLGGGTVGATQCVLYKTGSPVASGSGIPNNVNVGGMVVLSTLVFLNGSTDYVEFYVWQNTGGSVNLQTTAGLNTFSGSMVRGA